MIHSSASRSDSVAVPDLGTPRRHLQPVDALTLGNALGISEQGIWGLVRNAHRLYHTVEIAKKSGGIRTLHIPHPAMAWAQRQILEAFLNRVDYPEHVSAYVPGRSTLDAAKKHAGKPVLIVVDIKDFFPSTPKLWVRDALGEHLGVSRHVEALLAALVTAPKVPGVRGDFRVPQGAPTSGAVANLVAMSRLDPAMLEISKYWELTYTRYADDLAFSSHRDLSDDAVSEILGEVLAATKAAGYRPNYDKVRVQRPHQQQRLLGMCINVRPNLPATTYRKVRALVHNVSCHGVDQTAQKYGYESGDALLQYLQGMLAYSSPLAPSRVRRLQRQLSNGVTGGPQNP